MFKLILRFPNLENQLTEITYDIETREKLQFILEEIHDMVSDRDGSLTGRIVTPLPPGKTHSASGIITPKPPLQVEVEQKQRLSELPDDLKDTE